MTRLVLVLVFAAAAPVLAQARPTAIRQADLQVGAGYVSANSDYSTQRYNGLGVYADLDLTNHYGGEFNIHQVNSGQGDSVYERTYELGFRYHRTYLHGLLLPYARVMYGRGVFNYPRNLANLAYNMYSLGAGLDYAATSRIHVRVDYEYERWSSFTPDSLTPQLLTIGAAYHFPGTLRGALRH